MMRSSSLSIPRFVLENGGGVRFRMPSKISALVVPGNACLPVAIS